MTDDARTQALEAARALEKQGQVDPAVRQVLRAGFVADAARVLAAAKRYADAGHLVMDALGVGPHCCSWGARRGEAEPCGKKAATCFAQAGDAKRAVELFLALGELAKAAEVAERAGDPAQAARIRARIEKKSGGGASCIGARGSSGADGRGEARTEWAVRSRAPGVRAGEGAA